MVMLAKNRLTVATRLHDFISLSSQHTTMPKCWPSLLFFLSVTLVLASSQSFENTAIVRTVELGGSVVHVTTTYAIKALEDGLKTYTVTLGRDEKAKTSWLQAMVKGQKTILAVKERPFDPTKYVFSSSPLISQYFGKQGIITLWTLYCPKPYLITKP